MLLRRLGRAMVPANAEAESKLQKIPEGRILKTKINLPRSTPAHRMFFAVIAAAAQHWPHNTDPNPEGDAELLRAWLLVRARHRDQITFPFPDDPIGRQMTMASVSDFVNRLRARGEHPFIRTGDVKVTDETTGEIMDLPAVHVFISKSMDYDHLDEAGFGPIRQHIYDDIEAAIGVRVDDLARETEADAA
jgi:hypothetical protein